MNVCLVSYGLWGEILIFDILIVLLLTLGLADYFLFCLTLTCFVGLLLLYCLNFWTFVIFCLFAVSYCACNAYFTYALYFVVFLHLLVKFVRFFPDVPCVLFAFKVARSVLFNSPLHSLFVLLVSMCGSHLLSIEVLFV